MGNSNSTSHARAASRHNAGKVDRSNSSVRGKMRDSRAAASVSTHPPHKHHTHQRPTRKSPTTLSPLLPTNTVYTSCRPSSLMPPPSASVGAARRLSASLLSEKARLGKTESDTSSDSLAEGIRAAEELSDMTLDTFSSCPLVGPRNITTQFEQSSELPKFGSCVFEPEVNLDDEAMIRLSSSAAELQRHESFEGRMTHSIAIVEDWLASQENSTTVVG